MAALGGEPLAGPDDPRQDRLGHALGKAARDEVAQAGTCRRNEVVDPGGGPEHHDVPGLRPTQPNADLGLLGHRAAADSAEP